MTISIPDTLTTDNSEKYIVSIRLRSGGLSFSAYSPSVSESFFYRDVEFDRTRPYVSSRLEEVSFIGKRNSIGRSLSFLPLRSFSSLMSFLRGLINGLT